MNSSVDAFDAAIGAFRSWYGADLRDEDVPGNAQAFREFLAGIDPQALEGDGWWPSVLDEVELGLL